MSKKKKAREFPVDAEFIASSLTVEARIGMDGERDLCVTTSDEIPWWEQLGLLRAAVLWLENEASDLWAHGEDVD